MSHIYIVPPYAGDYKKGCWILTTKVANTNIYQWYSVKPTKPQIRKFKKMCKKTYAHLYESERILGMSDEKFKQEFP